MLTGKTKTRPATMADFRSFFGRSAPHTIRARVLEIDGEVMGIAGYYLVNGAAFVFSDNKEGIPMIRIWREAKAFMESLNLPAICMADENSGPFLERLGWQSVDGEFYKWQVS